MDVKTFYATVIDAKASRALGQPQHVLQVTAVGRFKSRAAFARALLAADLAAGSEASVSRYLSQYGSEGIDMDGIEDEVVYVLPLNKRREDKPLKWTGEQ